MCGSSRPREWTEQEDTVTQRRALVVVMATGLLAPVPAHAWGPVVHVAVTAKAIDTLPAA
jgi:hypothetical protein